MCLSITGRGYTGTGLESALKSCLEISCQETTLNSDEGYCKNSTLIKLFDLSSTCKLIHCLFLFKVQCSIKTLVSYLESPTGEGLYL